MGDSTNRHPDLLSTHSAFDSHFFAFAFNAMHFTTLAASLALFAGATFAQQTETASFDNTFDNAGGSTDTVACSNLDSQFPDFGSFPTFPNIGGAFAISGFGSAECGSCWQLTFPGTGNTIFVTAIDHTDDGFNLSEAALNTLTNGQAEQDGRVNVTAEQVDASNCGL